MQSREASFKFVGFFDLVCDASFTYFRSRDSKDHYEQNRSARASILAAALSVESFANCLIDALNLPANHSRKIERLPTLNKIDACLTLSALETLDPARPEVQKASDLIRARNDFVHIKTSKAVAQVAPARLQSTDSPRWDFSPQPDFYPTLGISKLPLAWMADDAHKALSAACAFIRHVASSEETRVERIRKSLISAIEVGGAAVPFVLPPYRDELRRLQNAGMDFLVLLSD